MGFNSGFKGLMEKDPVNTHFENKLNEKTNLRRACVDRYKERRWIQLPRDRGRWRSWVLVVPDAIKKAGQI